MFSFDFFQPLNVTPNNRDKIKVVGTSFNFDAENDITKMKKKTGSKVDVIIDSTGEDIL